MTDEIKMMFEKLGYVVYEKIDNKKINVPGAICYEIYIKRIDYENNKITDIFKFESTGKSISFFTKKEQLHFKELQAITKLMERYEVK